MRCVILALLLLASGTALANFSMIQFSNNTVPAGGFLLDNSAGFLTPDVAGNKIFAR